jgi:hypothetical protein
VLPANLRALILTPNVIKVGVSVRDDLLQVATAWGLPELHKSLHGNSEPSYVDLGQLGKLKGAVSSADANLATLVAVVLRCRIEKHDGLTFADWSMPKLSDDHQIYAALFAYAPLQMWLALSSKLSVNLPVERAVRGQLVSLMSGRKIAAYGILADQPAKISVLVGSETKELKLTAKRAVVTVQKSIIGGMLVKAQKLTLQELGSPPFTIVVPLSSLHTRNAEEPQQVASGPLPAIPNLPLNFPAPRSAEEVMSQDKPESNLDQDEDEHEVLTDMDDDPPDDDQQDCLATPKEDQMQVDSEDEYDTPETRAELTAFLNMNMAEEDQPAQQFNVGSA